MSTRGHSALTNDAAAAVGGWVTVTRVDGAEIEGVLYTVDPETGAVFVINRAPVEGSGSATASSTTHTHDDADHGGGSGDVDGCHDVRQHDTGNTIRGGCDAVSKLRVMVVTGHSVSSVQPLSLDSARHTSTTAADMIMLAEAALRPPSAVGGGGSVENGGVGADSSHSGGHSEQRRWALARLAEHRVPCVETDGVIVVLDGVAVLPPPYVVCHTPLNNGDDYEGLR